MRCPFLREAQVKSCRASIYQKMIVRAPGGAAGERCTSPEYVDCPAARQRHEERPSDAHCPFLQESLVQYCAAAPVTKYIPWSESMTTRCGNDGHRWCDMYLSLAEPDRPDGDTGGAGDDDEGTAGACVGEVSMPRGLAWASNHMWLDESGDGHCHLGVDMFLTRVLGNVQAVSFPTIAGVQRPAAVLRAHGVDFSMIFPASLEITGVNGKLRTEPERLIEEPYRKGWLFEARAGEGRPADVAGLLRRRAAVEWMRREADRLTRFVHDEMVREPAGEPALPADGGEPMPGVAKALHRDSLLRLYHEFFSPCEGRRGRE